MVHVEGVVVLCTHEDDDLSEVAAKCSEYQGKEDQPAALKKADEEGQQGDFAEHYSNSTQLKDDSPVPFLILVILGGDLSNYVE